MSNTSISNETIITVLREMLSNLCMGCGGCHSGHCLDRDVLDYLLKEKEGDVSGK